MSQVNATQGTSLSSVLSVSKERVVMALSLLREPEVVICVLREAWEEKNGHLCPSPHVTTEQLVLGRMSTEPVFRQLCFSLAASRRHLLDHEALGRYQ